MEFLHVRDNAGLMTPGPPIDEEIQRYYQRGAENDRLRSSVGRLEFWRTQQLLRRWLPPAPAEVLDIGGASGVHAEWLAKDGYHVHVIDPIPLHVSQADDLPNVTASIGDARNLDVAGESADVVLLLGPLYHLIARTERLAALSEAARAVRPGGLVAAAGISRFASMRDSLRKGWVDDEQWVRTVERAVATGQHVNDDGHEGRFTTAYFHYPDDLVAELVDAGLTDAEVFAVEGPGSFLDNLDELLDAPVGRRVLMKWIELVEQEPAMIGASSHLIAVGRRL